MTSLFIILIFICFRLNDLKIFNFESDFVFETGKNKYSSMLGQK